MSDILKIIAGFPGVGKSALAQLGVGKDIEIHDLDSSTFSWLTNDDGEKIRNPEFPKNYVDHIKTIEKGIVLVSTHKEVREALKGEQIPFTIVYPMRNEKDEYMQRYVDRGSPSEFLDLMANRWDDFIDELEREGGEFVSKFVIGGLIKFLKFVVMDMINKND